MVFGEIVEPTTRALIDCEYEEYPEYELSSFDWKGESKCPLNINNLFFIENLKVAQLFKAYVMSEDKVICSLKNGLVEIYQLENKDFVFSYTQKELTTGEIIQAIEDWINKAKNIYTITVSAISDYQNNNLLNKPETLLRFLSTSDDFPKLKKLEAPNLVSGLGADVLSYCIHTGLKCSLFVLYMDNLPLDSVNTKPVLQLLQDLKIKFKTNQAVFTNFPSNLYL